MPRRKIVVIGGGFSGLNVVRALNKADADVLLIDKKNHHLFQPLLYQVASAALSPADIATPLREILKDQANATVIMGEVIHIGLVDKVLTLRNGDQIPFDALVIAVGARHSYFGHDEWEAYAPGLKTLADAIHIREKILLSFEMAERMHDPEKATQFLNFAVIGGGPTGVEMAGAIAEIAYRRLFKNFRRIDPAKSKIYLIEALPKVLPPYPDPLSARAKQDLEKLGVRVLLSTMVTDVSSEGVTTAHGFIPARNVIWAAGNQVSALLKDLGVEQDKQGRVMVESDCSVPGHNAVFVIGDAAHFKGKDQKPLAGIAPVAIQQGRFVGKILKKEIPKNLRHPFQYFDKGNLATIGTLKAVGFVGKVSFSGFIAWLAWAFIHIMYLITFRNRYAVLLNWYFHYVSGMLGARLIHHALDEDFE